MTFDPNVLLEDNHLLVLNKPVNLPTMGVAKNEPSLVEWAREYIRHKHQKPGNVYLGVVSRLDALASGAIVLARTSKAAARLSEQFRSGEVEKTYWALVSPPPTSPAGEWTDMVLKDERRQRMIVTANSPSAQLARLSYRVVAEHQSIAWIEVQLETGRKHQIRLQCSSRGSPILGDRKYGSTRPFPSGIALHSARLVFTHPTRKEPVEILARPPSAWFDYAAKCGFKLYPWQNEN